MNNLFKPLPSRQDASRLQAVHTVTLRSLLVPPFDVVTPSLCVKEVGGRGDCLAAVTLQTIKRLGVISGTWVNITYSGRSPVVLLYALLHAPPSADITTDCKGSYEDDTIYFSPLYFFNLTYIEGVVKNQVVMNVVVSVSPVLALDPAACVWGCSKSASFTNLTRTSPSYYASLLHETCIQSLPRVLSAEVVRINSPVEVSLEDVDYSFQVHFLTSPMILQTGHIFIVPLVRQSANSSGGAGVNNSSNGSNSNNNNNSSSPPSSGPLDSGTKKVLYFRVIDIRVERRSFVGKSKSAIINGPPGSCSTAGMFVPSFSKLVQKWGGRPSFIPPPSHFEYLRMAMGGSILDSDSHVYDLDVASSVRNYLLPLLHPSLSHRISRAKGVVTVIINGPVGSKKKDIVTAVASSLSVHIVERSFYDLLGSSDGSTVDNIDTLFSTVVSTSLPCILYISHLPPVSDMMPEAGFNAISVAIERNLQAFSSGSNSGQPFEMERQLVVVGSTTDSQDIAKCIRSIFHHEINIAAPESTKRESLLADLTSRMNLAPDVSLSRIAESTAGRAVEELEAIISTAGQYAIQRCMKLNKSRSSGVMGHGSSASASSSKDGGEVAVLSRDHSVTLQWSDVEGSLTHHKKLAGSNKVSASQVAEIPTVHWDDVGGLAEVKNDILDMVYFPIKFPELCKRGVVSRSGILLYGPPGTGKTLLAKAVATECKLNFLSVKGPELLNMYVGESEKNVRQIFRLARAAKPSILFFDELDSLAPARGAGSDSGGVMDRVVSQLLTELDGMESSDGVYVIGATNRPDLLDPALMRPGRLDKLHYIGVPQDVEGKLQVMRALTRKFTLASDVNFHKVLANVSPNLTGADLYALCSTAYATALKARVEDVKGFVDKYSDMYDDEVEEERGPLPKMTPQEILATNPHLLKVMVTQDNFINAAENLVPSVSESDLRGYESLRAKFI